VLIELPHRFDIILEEFTVTPNALQRGITVSSGKPKRLDDPISILAKLSVNSMDMCRGLARV